MKDLKRGRADRSTDRNTDRSPGADPMVTMLLRAQYAPPANDEFWAGLQHRIVSRLQEKPVVSWSTAVCEWRNVGLVAATIALLVSGATLMREQSLDATTRLQAASAAVNANPDEIPDGVPVVITVRAKDSLPENLPERYLNPFEP